MSLNKTSTKPQVLIVDDESLNLDVLSEALKGTYKIVVAKSGEDALKRVSSKPLPDLILLDVMMPDIDGYEVCRRLKADPKLKNIPVIFVTALNAEEDEAKGFELGALDYITKPYSIDLVRARVHTHIELAAIRQNLEQRVEERTKDLEISRKEADTANRAKSNFLANINHELRTPLNAIIGFSEMMKEETFGEIGNDIYKDYIDTINQSGIHLLSVVGDILDISVFEMSGEIELKESVVDVSAVVISSAKMVLERAARAEIEVSTNVPDDLPFMRADQVRLKQILLNLLDNAVKFSKPGGKVTASAEIDDKGKMTIKIADNGIGIAAADISEITKTFGQAQEVMTRSHGGSGLGLPIVLAMTELHGGSVEINSDLGKGTTVTVRFPLSRVL